MTAEETDPIVEVVGDDEEDVGPGGGCGGEGSESGDEKQADDEGAHERREKCRQNEYVVVNRTSRGATRS